VEREQVVDEIRRNILYSEENVARAMLVLDEDTASTRQENIKRICKAFAQVDTTFAGVHELVEDGQYRDAADRLRKRVSLQEQSWYGAAKLYVYAVCLAESGDRLGALEAFGGLVVHMPDRVSFASSAASGTARTYEQLHQRRYALQMYRYVLRNYGTSLGPANHERLIHKIHELEVSLPADGNAPPACLADLCLTPDEDLASTPVAEQELVEIVSDLLRTLRTEPQLPTGLDDNAQPAWGIDGPDGWDGLDAPERDRLFELADQDTRPAVREAVRSYHDRLGDGDDPDAAADSDNQ
jgi:hypothetical protein